MLTNPKLMLPFQNARAMDASNVPEDQNKPALYRRQNGAGDSGQIRLRRSEIGGSFPVTTEAPMSIQGIRRLFVCATLVLVTVGSARAQSSDPCRVLYGTDSG